MELKTNFKQWACSLSGCDGGNPKADIWICGIEWGYNKNDKTQEEYYKVDLPQEIANGEYYPSEKYKWKDSLEYPYGRNVAKLYSAIIGEKVSDYKKVADNRTGSEIFKMNLYPIAFNNTDEQLWKKYRLNEVTGFEEKNLFKTWCYLHRFPAISRFVNENKPKLIIGIGISYLTDFFVCFAGDRGVNTTIYFGEILQESGMGKLVRRTYFWAKLINGTTLVVIPFFSGSYGLNSDFLIQETGLRIKELIA